jgi:NADH-quinone oxidoreductase subunit M
MLKVTDTFIIGWSWQVFSGIFSVLVFGVLFFLSLYAPEMFKEDEDPIPFYALMLLLTGAIYMVFTATDLVALFFSWEIMSLVAFVMLLYYDRTKEGGPWLYAFWSGLSAMSMLAGILILESVVKSVFGKAITLPFWGLGGFVAPVTPNPKYSAFIQHPWLVVLAFILIGIPFLVKASVPPFHTWAPKTYGSTHPAVAAFFSAAYSKVGIYAIFVWLYGMFKLSLGASATGSQVASIFANVRNMPAVFFLLAVVVSVGSVVFSLLALAQKDAMYLLAYSSMGQLGYMILAMLLGIGYSAYSARTEVALVIYMLGIWGAVYHAYAHGVFELSAYMALGAVYARSGETEFNKLGAYGHRMPVTFWLGFVAMLSTVSIPLMWGFASKYMIYQTALYGRFFVLAALALISGTASFLYAFRYLHGIFWGQPTKGYEYMHRIKEVGVVGVVVSFALMLLTVIGGASPYMVLNFVSGNLVVSMLRDFINKLFSVPLVFDIWHASVYPFSGVNFLFMIVVFVVGMIVATLVYVLSGGSKKVPLGDFYNSAEPPRPEWQLQLMGVFYGPIERVIEPYFRISVDAFYSMLGSITSRFAEIVEAFNTGDTRDYVWAMAVMLAVLAIVWLV